MHLDAHCLLAGHSCVRVEAAPELTPVGDQDGSQGERRRSPLPGGKDWKIRKTCPG